MKSGKTTKKNTHAGKAAQAPAAAPEPTAASGSEIDRLGKMSIGELQSLFAEVVGEPTRCPTRSWLVRKIVEAKVSATPEAETRTDDSALDGQGAATAPTDAALVAPLVDGAAAGTTAAVTESNAVAGDTEADPPTPSPKLSELDVPALRALYREVIGRDTTSESRNYLVWKLRAAQSGRVPVGPRASQRQEGGKVMVLPLRMEATLVGQIDDTWRRLGLRSRMDLIRAALSAYLGGVGEAAVANLIAPKV